jgi:hypothetical protein
MAHTSGETTLQDVITSAAQSLGDPDGKKVGRPRYLQIAQRGMMQLFQHIPYDMRSLDVPMVAGGIVSGPKVMSNLIGVYLYNGERCSPLGDPVRVWEKERYHRAKGTSGFSHVPWGYQQDPMTVSPGMATAEPNNLLYFGFRNNEFHFSPSCEGYAWVRFDYAGLGFDKYGGDEEMYIPFWAFEALVDWVQLRAAEILQHEEGKTMTYTRVISRKEQSVTGMSGSWMQAMMHWARMDAKDRADTVIYISRIGYAGESFT